LDHPLAMEEKPESPTLEVMPSVPKLARVEYSNVALHLTPNDIDRIRIFIREYVFSQRFYLEKPYIMFSYSPTLGRTRSSRF
jgi:hypothetical protein